MGFVGVAHVWGFKVQRLDPKAMILNSLILNANPLLGLFF